MMTKVALFDFDNTVAQGNSITRLIHYDLKKRPWHVVFFVSVCFYYVLYLLRLSSFEKAKSALLFPLRYMDQAERKMFYQRHVEIYYYPHIVEEMKRQKAAGYHIILCTASAEAYMKYNQLPIDCLIGTQIEECKAKQAIKIVGKNCKKEEKVKRIHAYLEAQNMVIDYENSYGYSDSHDDLPMLALVKHRKRILLKTGQISQF